MFDKKCIEIAAQCLRDEAQAIIDQINYLDENFEAAANLILSCKGKLVVTARKWQPRSRARELRVST